MKFRTYINYVHGHHKLKENQFVHTCSLRCCAATAASMRVFFSCTFARAKAALMDGVLLIVFGFLFVPGLKPMVALAYKFCRVPSKMFARVYIFIESK